jgi:F-type H+-transporting ATPase subunit epsilon
MAGTFKFELVSPEKILASEDAEQVVVPGSEGDFAVLPGHAPVLSTLRPGVLDITLPGGKTRRVFVKGGFCEVDPESLTVLTQQAVDLADASNAWARKELAIAEGELAAAKDDASQRFAQEAVERLKALQGTLKAA